MRKEFVTDTIQLREEEVQQPLSMHPQKFAMWLFIVSVIMVFVALTSAYIVGRSDGGYLEINLPPVFATSTVILVLSSISLHWAYISAKKDNLDQLKIAMFITAILGGAFLWYQFQGWSDLVDIAVHFVGNPSGSFIYVFSGLHGLHLISALIFLAVMVIKTFRYRVHSKNMVNMDMLVTYWHFLDGLWVYLFLFLWINN